MQGDNLILFLAQNIIFGASTLFQIQTMAKTKSSKDVGLLFVGFLLLGIGCTYVLTLTSGASLWVKLERFISLVNMAILFGAVIYWRVR
jgi:hypothetical protein